MSDSPQLTLDLEGNSIESRWNVLAQAEANNWTEEALCVQWISGRNAPDWEWWRGLPSYERRRWLCDYQFARSRVDAGLSMLPAITFTSQYENDWKQTKALAASWAPVIRAAFKDGQPCPIRTTGLFEAALDMAIDLARIPAACLAHPKEVQA
jgi:hypothetical protein